MASVSQLGYLGFGVGDIGEWERFASEILGLQVSERCDDGSLRLRMDEHHYRFTLHPHGNDDLAYVGWEVPNREAMAAVAGQLKAAGTEVTRGSEAETQARCVAEMIRFRDPNGVASEVFYGPLVESQPFASPRPISGFRTGAMGLGHFILLVNDLAASAEFYTKVLGFRVSDLMTLETGGIPTEIVFLHCNPRHHSIALIANPSAKKRIDHFMLEARTVDDVGATFELCEQRELPIIAALGRHTNDRMFSFYLRSPSRFAIEYGCGARTVDDATWEIKTYTAGTVWGHRGLRERIAGGAGA